MEHCATRTQQATSARASRARTVGCATNSMTNRPAATRASALRAGTATTVLTPWLTLARPSPVPMQASAVRWAQILMLVSAQRPSMDTTASTSCAPARAHRVRTAHSAPTHWTLLGAPAGVATHQNCATSTQTTARQLLACTAPGVWMDSISSPASALPGTATGPTAACAARISTSVIPTPACTLGDALMALRAFAVPAKTATGETLALRNLMNAHPGRARMAEGASIWETDRISASAALV